MLHQMIIQGISNYFSILCFLLRNQTMWWEWVSYPWITKIPLTNKLCIFRFRFFFCNFLCLFTFLFFHFSFFRAFFFPSLSYLFFFFSTTIAYLLLSQQPQHHHFHPSFHFPFFPLPFSHFFFFIFLSCYSFSLQWQLQSYLKSCRSASMIFEKGLYNLMCWFVIMGRKVYII